MIKSQKGFTLLEVIIALTIMMGSVLVVAMAWSGSQLRIKKMKLNNQAAYLLDYKMAEMERKYKTELTLIPEQDEGDFQDLGKEYKNFTWVLKSQKFEMPDITPLLKAGNDGGADPMMMMLMGQMSEFFGQAVKEVTISVVFTFGKNKVQYSASEFMIDFNQQLPLPNMGAPGGP